MKYNNFLLLAWNSRNCLTTPFPRPFFWGVDGFSIPWTMFLSSNPQNAHSWVNPRNYIQNGHRPKRPQSNPFIRTVNMWTNCFPLTMLELLGQTLKAHSPIFSNILMGFYSDWLCKCTRQIWSPTLQTDGRHAIARPRFALKCIAR